MNKRCRILSPLVVGILLLSPLLRAQGTEPGPSAPVRLRGFTVSRLSPDVLDDATCQWRANAIRHQFSIALLKHRDHLTIDEAWNQILAALPGGLDVAASRGLTVILSIPQDVLVNADSALSVKENQAHFWKDDTGYAALAARWRQIVAICAQRHQPIWYDLLNEPLNRSEAPLTTPSAWPRWAQRLIDEIRQTDAAHPIVIEPGPGSLCWGFKTFPALHGNNLIYSVHQYQPQAYTHQGIGGIGRTDLAQAYLQKQCPWPCDFKASEGGAWDKDRIAKELAPVCAFQQRNPGVRIYVGEFSVVRWAPNGAQYLRDCLELFERNGWDWTYHAFREFNGWSLEHDETFSTGADAKPAKEPTERGKVVRAYLRRNDVSVSTVP